MRPADLCGNESTPHSEEDRAAGTEAKKTADVTGITGDDCASGPLPTVVALQRALGEGNETA